MEAQNDAILRQRFAGTAKFHGGDVCETGTSNASAANTSEVTSKGDHAVAMRNAKLIEVINFDFFYGRKQALFEINLEIPERKITAPSAQFPS